MYSLGCRSPKGLLNFRFPDPNLNLHYLPLRGGASQECTVVISLCCYLAMWSGMSGVAPFCEILIFSDQLYLANVRDMIHWIHVDVECM